MSKTLLALLCCFIFLIAVLLFLKSEPIKQTALPSAGTTIPPTPEAVDTLSFHPDVLTIPASSSATIAVTITSSPVSLSLIQFEIAYDPTLLSNPIITPGTFLNNPTVTLNTIDTNDGRISYALETHSDQPPQRQSGTIATITFTTANVFFPARTQLSFLQKTELQTVEGNFIPVSTTGGSLTILPLSPPPVTKPFITAQTPKFLPKR